ncbi:membrane protein DedA with SNARE-associated domain [Kroppenstedtia sanguinis]|uniref:DedA family protein n=1 Tax=Kroppenstedtia sanguinis TaxID=1380684 RepID=A0ABW4C6A4_9BACL
MEQTVMDLLSQYGYLGIFFFLVLGIIGLPLPDEIMMTFIGYLTSIGQLNLVFAFLSAVAGSMCGITVSYYLGGRLGYPFLKRYGSKFFITPKRLRTTQILFRKYGNWVLLFGYFIPGVRHVTAYMAGISRMSPFQFASYAYVGAFTWCTAFIGLGYLVGAQWESVFQAMHRYGLIALWILIPVLVLVIARFLYVQHDRYNSLRK